MNENDFEFLFYTNDVAAKFFLDDQTIDLFRSFVLENRGIFQKYACNIPSYLSKWNVFQLEYGENAASSGSGTTAASNSKSTEKCRNGGGNSSGCGSAADQLVPDIVVTSNSRESDGSGCPKNPIMGLQATALA